MATPLRRATATGVLFGAVAIYVAMVGLLSVLHTRWIVVDCISLGQVALLAIAIGAGLVAARSHPGLAGVGAAMLAGMAAGATLAALVVVMAVVDLRGTFIALSPQLLALLTFNGTLARGVAVLLGAGAALAGSAALLARLPRLPRRFVVAGATAVLAAGAFTELIQVILQAHPQLDTLREHFYGSDGLTGQGAAWAACLGATASALGTFVLAHMPAHAAAPHGMRRWAPAASLLLLLTVLPLIAGSYIDHVLMVMALYILMGIGLNLEVGLAGLLDLGFVAFFAVGAYTTALLTGDNTQALAALSFWAAMPIAVLMSVMVGVLFGIPVLGMRGDYLAVATMGLGEIVRIVVVSDFASPLFGGAQGLVQVPRPALAGRPLDSPLQLYYLTFVAALIATYVAWRLEKSRLGRAWMAVRDDEDVAESLGVDLMRVKLLAYGLGAAFAGLAGSLFATMVSSVYPSSFQLAISVNVLALILVGGIGSLAGIVIGAAALVGLPELLREFGEYRYLLYGTALIVMMRLRPEGLWPSGIGRPGHRRVQA
jgi:branched-chain amino acid transport system permease protein